MLDLGESLKAVGDARRRRKELRRLLEVLYGEYKLIKTEIELHEARIEELMSSKEYSAYLDTIKLDKSLEFAIQLAEEPTGKK